MQVIAALDTTYHVGLPETWYSWTAVLRFLGEAFECLNITESVRRDPVQNYLCCVLELMRSSLYQVIWNGRIGYCHQVAWSAKG
jgi:hypothetical protein